MKTIKERAQSYTDKVGILGAYLGYIAGATEQEEIDSLKITELRKERDAYYDRLQELREELAQKDEENGKTLLYAVDKTTERVKREMLGKACEWLTANANKYASYAGMSNKLIDDFRKAMEAETCNSDKNLQELTWEDVQRIVEINYSIPLYEDFKEQHYREVLKRFNEGE